VPLSFIAVISILFIINTNNMPIRLTLPVLETIVQVSSLSYTGQLVVSLQFQLDLLALPEEGCLWHLDPQESNSSNSKAPQDNKPVVNNSHTGRLSDTPKMRHLLLITTLMLLIGLLISFLAIMEWQSLLTQEPSLYPIQGIYSLFGMSTFMEYKVTSQLRTSHSKREADTSPSIAGDWPFGK
jgi:hypothetical protein